MAVIVVGSVASAGATSVSLGLAAVSAGPGRPVVMVECDPCGGVLAARHRLALSPGLVELAAAARAGASPGPDLLAASTQPVRIGDQTVGIVVAPPGAAPAPIMVINGRREILSPSGVTVVVDCGRLTFTSPAFGLIKVADVVVVVVRARVEELAHLRQRGSALARAAGGRLVVVLAPGGVYPADEVGAVLTEPFGRPVTVWGPLPYDERSARILDGELRPGARWQNLPLCTALEALAATFTASAAHDNPRRTKATAGAS